MVEPKLNKFESVRLLAARCLQISDGGKLYVDPDNESNAFALTKKEFKAGKTPLKILKEDK